MRSRSIDVMCIKWGDKYGADHVNRLARGVAKHMDRPFRFHCFTDDPCGIDAGIELRPLPQEPFEEAMVAAMTRKTGRQGAWRKVSLFKQGLEGLTNRRMILDLDIIITGDLGTLIDLAPDKVCMRHEWRYERLREDGGHGSFTLLDPERHGFLYDVFAQDVDAAVGSYKGSEQYYTSMVSMARDEFQYIPGDLICSFKRDCMHGFPANQFLEPIFPPNCRVLCFHGKPKMEDAVSGFRELFFRRSRPAKWLSEAYNV